jgi:hypothetical protein
VDLGRWILATNSMAFTKTDIVQKTLVDAGNH